MRSEPAVSLQREIHRTHAFCASGDRRAGVWRSRGGLVRARRRGARALRCERLAQPLQPSVDRRLEPRDACGECVELFAERCERCVAGRARRRRVGSGAALSRRRRGGASCPRSLDDRASVACSRSEISQHAPLRSLKTAGMWGRRPSSLTGSRGLAGSASTNKPTSRTESRAGIRNSYAVGRGICRRCEICVSALPNGSSADTFVEDSPMTDGPRHTTRRLSGRREPGRAAPRRHQRSSRLDHSV